MNYAQIVAYVGNSYCTVGHAIKQLNKFGGDAPTYLAALQEHYEGLGLTAPKEMRIASVAPGEPFSPASGPTAPHSPGSYRA
jgi:hypothetical protein